MSERRVIGVVLAGGASRRMGGMPKAKEAFGEGTLLTHAIDRLGDQVDRVIVNGPTDLTDSVPRDVEVIPDPFTDRRGPLAGILAALAWCEREVPDATELVSAPVDTPFFPEDLTARLTAARSPEGNALARSGGRTHPTFGAWNIALREALQSFLATSETNKVLAFTERHACGFADFDDPSAFDNANTPEDLGRVRERLRA